MNRLIFATLLISFMSASCGKSEKIQECKKLGEADFKSLEGFTIENMTYESREGLKLAIPDEYESSTHISSIRYKNDNESRKGITCYYSEDGSMMGYDVFENE